MRKFLFVVVALVCSVGAFAQEEIERNQLGLLLGFESIGQNTTTGAPGAPVKFGRSETMQLNFAHRITGENTQFWMEFPSVAGPSHSVTSSNAATPVSLATFFTTPSFRVAFRGRKRVNPWLSFGGGYALYEGSENLRTNAVNANRFTSTGALQFGAGADVTTPIRIWKRIGLRGEIRDFYSFDTLDFTSAVTDNRQHNVVVSGGFIVRF